MQACHQLSHHQIYMQGVLLQIGIFQSQTAYF